MALTMQGGVKIPVIGLGTWQATDEEELEKALNAALEIGYRHIDTAAAYNNEHIIGRVLEKWFTAGKLKREEVFITTKLPVQSIHPDLVESAMKDSLEKLQMDYVDLYLVHFPILMKNEDNKMVSQPTDHLGVWKKMEDQVDAKRARTIGISNFSISQIERIIKNARIKPANTQIELHIYHQQRELVEFCRKNDIVVVSYSSLGSPGANDFFKKIGRGGIQLPNILNDPVATKIAEKHNKTTGQVVLRYLTQKDIVVIPKSVSPKRLQENYDILDYTLDPEDIEALERLDKGEAGRIFWMDFISPHLPQHPEYPFKK